MADKAGSTGFPLPITETNLAAKIAPINSIKFIVKEFTYYEALSESSVLEVVVYPQDPDKELIDLKTLRTELVKITWTYRDDDTKEGKDETTTFKGYVDEISCIGQDDKTAFYKIIAKPAITFFNAPKFNIFQKVNIKLKDVITTMMGINTLASIAGHTEKNSPVYATKNLFVQYDEGDWDFLQRHLADEGKFFYFDRASESKFTIDHKVPTAKKSSLVYRQFMPQDLIGIDSFGQYSKTFYKKYTAKDYNFSTTQTGAEKFGLKGEKAITGKNLDEATYFPGKVNAQAAATLTTAAENFGFSESNKEFYVQGTSNYGKLCPLYCFDITGYPSPTAKVKDTNIYYTTAVKHHFIQVSYHDEVLSLEDNRHAKGRVYWNEFTALPKEHTFRAPIIKKTPPTCLSGRVFSAEASKEIDIDDKGLVLVQFPWDTLSAHNTCRIRFMQPWAGAGFGVTFVPRVGMEVIIGFENNDIDRPIILGCVHNNMNAMNAQITTDPTTSIIRSQSSKYNKDAPGFNEIKYVDAVGAEILSTHAQKDQQGYVGNDELRIVQNNHITNVLKQAYEVRVMSASVEAKDAEAALKNASLKAYKHSGTNMSFYVEKGNTYIENKEGDQEMTVTKGKITITDTEGNITVHAKKGMITIQASDNITIKTDKNIDIQGKNINLKADNAIAMNAKNIEGNGSAGVTVKGAKMDLKATGAFNAQGAQVNVKGTAQTTVKGAMATVEGSALTTVKGGVVMVN